MNKEKIQELEANLNQTSDPLRIRGHHLLCIQGFQGYGYSQDFEDHMLEVVNYIRSNPSYKVEVVAEADEICSHCPHNVEEKCLREPDSDENIRRMDLLVLETLKIDEGFQFEAFRILKHVNQKLKTRNDVQKICGDCSWMDKCLWFDSKHI